MKATNRSKAALLARNFQLLTLLLFSTPESFSLLASSMRFQRQVQWINHQSFTRLAPTILSHMRRMKSVVVGSNFPRSVYFAALSCLGNDVGATPLTRPLLSDAESTLIRPYYIGVPVVVLPLSRRTFMATLHKFLRISIQPWSSWPLNYRPTVSHLSVSQQWSLLRFVNMYYFKVYRV